MVSKKNIAILFCLSTLVLSISAALYCVLPFEELDQLKNGYIAVTVKDGVPSYKIVNAKPLNYVELNKVSRHAYNAIQISEDWAFYDHIGIDLGQIRKAFYDFFTGSEKLRGASTISQQLVKNLFLNSERSFKRKIKEAAITAVLEFKISKSKILELYLNAIEFGDGIYGIKAASNYYFNQDPLLLSPKDGAFLAMLLPNPKSYATSFYQHALTPYAETVVMSILNKMKIAGLITPKELYLESQKKLNFEHTFVLDFIL